MNLIIYRNFLLIITAGCIPLTLPGLLQTIFMPMYYTIPGITSDNIFYGSVNIIGTIALFFLLVECTISMDCLFMTYLFYFHGEIYSINSVAKLLNNREILITQCDKVLRTIYKAHRKALKQFSFLYNVTWHFYFQKFFGALMYLCTGLFIFSRISNSIIFGIIIQTFALSQLLLLCIPGQLVKNCSESLRDTLYMSLWYELDIKDKRKLIIIMNGVHRGIHAETFGIGRISIFTFVQVFKSFQKF